jgi:hypothetical protein
MKKKLSILAFLGFLFSAQTAIAQRDYRFGISLNPGISWYGTEANTIQSGTRARVGFGLAADLAFADRLSILTGVNYQGRGARAESDSYILNTQVNYIEIPAALKMKTAQFDRMTYFAKFGTILGIRANETSELTEKNNAPVPGETPSRTVSTISNIFQIGLGAEYELRGGTALFASIDLNMSYYNNLRKNQNPLQSNQDMRFNMVALNFGLLF